MRILQVHNRYVEPGGEDTISDAEAALLTEAGHDVDVLRVHNPEDRLSAARAFVAAPYNFAQERAMRARVRSFAPDLAHVHNTWFALSPSVFRALRTERVPTVMTLQNFRPLCAEAKLFRDGGLCTDCVGTHPWRGVRYACYRGSVPASIVAATTIALHRKLGTWDKIDRFFAPSESVKTVFVEGGFPGEKIVVKPNVVRDPGPRALPPSESPTVLYAGRLSPEKGLALLLEAWREAAPTIPELELVIVGDGPQREALERAAPERVRFHGYVEPEALVPIMLAARALVFPTQWPENFGRTIVEAMAAGLPVLASDIGTPAELVGRLGPDWLVLPSSRPEWVTGLTRLADSTRVDGAGRRARELFERDYNFDVGLRALLDVYRKMIPHGAIAPAQETPQTRSN
jgi:glycosyltransferase involved in cell wall biosynthesis